MAEQKTAQQTVREQYKVAENLADNMLRAWSELASATADYTFGNIEKGLRYSQDARAQSERLANEALANYRRIYEDGFKTWQSYIQGVGEILSRTN